MEYAKQCAFFYVDGKHPCVAFLVEKLVNVMNSACPDHLRFAIVLLLWHLRNMD